MAELTLVELEERHVGGLVASAKGDKLAVKSAFSEPFSDAGALQEILRRQGFSGRKAILVVPRRYVLVRELSLPPAAPEEMPAMVRFQLSRDLPMPVEQVRYVLQETEKTPERIRFLAMVVPENILAPQEEILSKAGVRVMGAAVTTQGLAELARDSASPTAVALATDESMEILAVSGGKILMTSHMLAEKGTAEETSDQLNRALASYLARSSDHAISKILTAGSRQAKSALRGIPVEPLAFESRLQGIPVPADLAAACGVALGIEAHGDAFPMLARPSELKKGLKVKAPIRIAALTAFALVAGIVYLASLASDKEEELQKVKYEESRLIKSVGALRASLDLADQWASKRRPWPDVLLDLSGIIDPKEIYLTGLTPEEDLSIVLTGRARRREAITALVDKFEKTKTLKGSSSQSSSEVNDKLGYVVEFTVKTGFKPSNGEEKK